MVDHAERISGRSPGTESNTPIAAGRRWPMWVPLALIVSAAALVTWPLWGEGRVLYWGIPMLQFYPWRTAAAEMIQAGHLPLWLQGAGNGAPLLANHQTAPFYPPNVLFLVLPAERAMGYSAMFHLALAGLGMAAFARSLRLTRFAASIGALAYMLSGFMITRLNFPTMTSAAAWLPFQLLLGERLATRPRRRDALALAVIIAAQFLAGHAQLWYYSLWTLGLYLAWRTWAVRRSASPRRTIALAALALALGLGLAAVQILPTAELARHSQRQTGAEYEFAMTYSFWPWRLITFFAPDFFGNPARGEYWGYANYWEDAGYVGVLTLLLLIPAVTGWLRGRRADGRPGALATVPFFLALAGGSLLLALGKNTPVYPLVFRYVPGFGLFQAPARLLCLTTFSLAALGAIGADHLTGWQGRGKALRLLAVVGMGLLAAALFVAYSDMPIKPSFGPALAQAAFLFVLSSLALLLSDARPARPSRVRSAAWQGLAAILLGTDLLLYGLPFNPTIDPSAYHLPNRTADFLKAETSEPFRIYVFDDVDYHIKYEEHLSFDSFGDPSPARQRALRETLVANANLIEGIESAGNYEPLLPRRYASLMDAVNRASPAVALRLLGLMNVAYILQPGPLNGIEPIDDGTLPTRVYPNPSVLPRAWIVPEAHCVADVGEALQALVEPDFDPSRTVVLEGCGDAPSPSRGEMGSGRDPSADVSLHYVANGVTIRADSPSGGYLILADTYYPGWRVRIDGESATIRVANVAFRAVELEAGPHVVEFRYSPTSFYLGAIVSGLASLILLVGLRRGKV